jgi:hypothetical protein
VRPFYSECGGLSVEEYVSPSVAGLGSPSVAGSLARRIPCACLSGEGNLRGLILP